MNLFAKCKCGGEINLEDTGVFINPDGRPNEKGQIYQLEIAFERWFEIHKKCPEWKP